MSRLPAALPEHLDPELAATIEAGNFTPVQKQAMAAIGQAPHMLKAISSFTEIAMTGARLPRRLIELVRLRIAFHNQCRTCMAMRHQSAIDDGLTEELVCSLKHPMEASDLTGPEKAALEYADIFATDHFAINDESYAKLRDHFTAAEIMELGVLVGYFLGFGRYMATLDLTEELPKAYQEGSQPMAPWEAQESILIRDVWVVGHFEK